MDRVDDVGEALTGRTRSLRRIERDDFSPGFGHRAGMANCWRDIDIAGTRFVQADQRQWNDGSNGSHVVRPVGANAGRSAHLRSKRHTGHDRGAVQRFVLEGLA